MGVGHIMGCSMFDPIPQTRDFHGRKRASLSGADAWRANSQVMMQVGSGCEGRSENHGMVCVGKDLKACLMGRDTARTFQELRTLSSPTS